MQRKGNLRGDMQEIFAISQTTTAVHQKNAILLKQCYEDDHQQFLDCLKYVINCILITAKPSMYLEKSMHFFGKFCSLLKNHTDNYEDNGIDHPLLTDIFTYLLQASCLVNDTIRLRSCQLVNTIFNNLVGVDLSEDLCESIENNLLIRLQDPKSAIRQQAVETLHWLQDPTNPEDTIIPEFLHLMNYDSFAKVRQLCTEKIAPRRDVVSSFINRTRDVDVNVRLAAYKRLSNLAGFLKISEKRSILQSGFLETAEKIIDFINNNFINSWLSHYENNILKFMEGIRLDADEDDIAETSKLYEKVLGVIFDGKTLEELSNVMKTNNKSLVPLENLNWEVSSYWRIYIQYLKKNEQFEAEIYKILPELVFFCKYVKEYYASMPKAVTSMEFLEQQYILKQFFLIIATYDFSDPVNRQCLNALVSNVLENIVLTSDVTEIVIKSLECSIPNVENRTQFVCEIISEILSPMNTEEAESKQKELDFEKCQISVKLQRLKVEQEDCVAQHNFLEAGQIEQKINELQAALDNLKEDSVTPQKLEKKSDILTVIKCLDIAAGILLSPQVTSLTVSLRTLKEDFINEYLISEHNSVRVKAFKCYALCCIVDKESSSNGIHIFSTPIFAYQNGQECDTQTLIISIGAVVDLLRIYGSQLVAASENDALSESMDEKHQVIFAGGTALTDVLQGLVDLMDDEQNIIQEKAAVGLCQLVLSRRIVSPSLIARLILKWCNPTTGSDKIKQTIAYTLQRIPLIQEYTATLQEAILITIKALYSAPKISPLADVNIENITKFMLALCKASTDAQHINSNLATTICEEMRDKPTSRMNTIYSKVLLIVELSDNKILLSDLLKLCDQIRDNITDRQIVKNISKFTTILNSKMQNGTISDGDEIEEDE